MPGSPAFAHVADPVAVDTAAAPGTTVHATPVAAPLAASCTALLPATCFALLTSPPNRLFFFVAVESVTAESAFGAGLGVCAPAGTATIAMNNDETKKTRAHGMACSRFRNPLPTK